METRYIRQMASMCAQTYYLKKLSVSGRWSARIIALY